MYIALENNHRVRPSKDLRKAICQCCGSSVIAKTGDKKVWHWAHEFLGDCTQKGKGEWHYFWQDQLDITEVEVRDPKWPNNIADICIHDPRLPDGYLVVELQESAISREEVVLRNTAYKNILWITNDMKRNYLQKSFKHDDTLPFVAQHTENNKIVYHNTTYDITDINIKELFVNLYLNTISANKPSLRRLEIPLTVSYNDRSKAKAMGAYWNPYSKQWYIPSDCKHSANYFDCCGFIDNNHWIKNSNLIFESMLINKANSIALIELCTIPEYHKGFNMYVADAIEIVDNIHYEGYAFWKIKPYTPKMLNSPTEFVSDLHHMKKTNNDIIVCTSYNASNQIAKMHSFLRSLAVN
jgi:hypothetical protein